MIHRGRLRVAAAVAVTPAEEHLDSASVSKWTVLHEKQSWKEGSTVVEKAVPGPHKYVKSLPLGLGLDVLGHVFTCFWDPGRSLLPPQMAVRHDLQQLRALRLLHVPRFLFIALRFDPEALNAGLRL